MPLSDETAFREMKTLNYAVRGPIVARAAQIDREIKEGSKKYPFDEIISCNVGNPQALGNGYLSFPRQVLALLSEPKLLDHPKVGELFPSDVIERARRMHKETGHSGGYTAFDGLMSVRKACAKAIEHRDDTGAGRPLGPADPTQIWLTDGASAAIIFIIRALINDYRDGIMCNVPQYPLYPATIQLCQGTLVPYYLDETHNWGINLSDLDKQYEQAKSMGINVRAMTVINPGNPTGRILEPKNLDGIIKFCHRRGLLLIADEVYQENIYTKEKKFHSFRERVLLMGSPYAEELQLISLHSTSKGKYGECGKRGGYMEMRNFPKSLYDAFLKLPALHMCANINGQWLCQLMMEPPQPGDASYEQYTSELSVMHESYVQRATSVCENLNKIVGVKCLPIEGAFYAFARLELPTDYIHYAESKGMAADDCWCMELLEATGLVTLSGTGFGQVPGTYHFRTTILPRAELMEKMVQKVKSFQESIWAKYDHHEYHI